MKQTKRKVKTKAEQAAYVNRIKELHSEPTVDESLDFSESDNKLTDYEVSEKLKTREPFFLERLGDHLKRNWPGYLIAVVIFLISLFGIELNRDVGNIEGKIDIIQKNVTDIKSKNEQLLEKVHSQDLKIQENSIRLDQLNGKANDINSKASTSRK